MNALPSTVEAAHKGDLAMPSTATRRLMEVTAAPRPGMGPALGVVKWEELRFNFGNDVPPEKDVEASDPPRQVVPLFAVPAFVRVGMVVTSVGLGGIPAIVDCIDYESATLWVTYDGPDGGTTQRRITGRDLHQVEQVAG